MVRSVAKYSAMVGNEYGQMTVQSVSDERYSNGSVQVVAQCSCGIVKTVIAAFLRSGTIKSCGCLSNMPNRTTLVTHGTWQKGSYNSWANAKRRCNNPNNPRYSRYGGRGIRVCSRWDTFEQFIADMGERPSAKHSLDRIDLDGDYTPENCKWSTNTEQCNNMSRNLFLYFEGRRMTVADWARELGVSYGLIQSRIKNGWTVRDTLTKPSMKVAA